MVGSSVNTPSRVSFRTVIKKNQITLRTTKLLLTVHKLNWCFKHSSLTVVKKDQPELHHKELNCTVKELDSCHSLIFKSLHSYL